ncbi:MAG: endonuclease III [Proteobacteria bacterium]|nr:endonuclease III [Burkholderiales bacterium]
MNPAKRRAIFERFARANPHPKGELAWQTPFQLLIAVILSAQATDRSVNLATPALFAAAPGAREMLALGREGIERYIRTIGLFRSKAKHVEQTCAALLSEHGGEVPDDRAALERLPGVGRKTANVILNIAFGHPTIAVDTHLFRLGNRIPIAPGKTPLEVEMRLLKFVPPQYLQHAHHWLILHGRYVCKAVRPECPTCLINDLCEYRRKTIAPWPA